ncbi:MAG: GNAT family N-acetyltransferase [Oscillospiraceae bacterium]|jgi:GNAT superfamily N-acetyltransferase|nr:GNAT family N-acetyltransferase [Oscillospiraceae bacterium]
MPAVTYVGPAEEYDYSELMALLNDVFFSGDAQPQRGFLSLLPKLYKPEYAPCGSNYIVKEDGVIKAAVGLYIYDYDVAGYPLRMGGIGNVAVAKDCRRKGYMKLTMDAAMRAMREAGCHFGALGGQRQRYNYWGFEKGGWLLHGSVNRTNLRHAYAETETALTVVPLAPGDMVALRTLLAAHEGELMHAKHARGAFFDVLCSWECTPRLVRDDHGIAAAFNLNRERNGISDLRLLRPDCFGEVMQAIFASLPKDVTELLFDVAPWDAALANCLESCGESCGVGCSGHFTVLNWQMVLQALFSAQAQRKALPAGDICVKICGAEGDEALHIKVRGGVPSITSAEAAPELALEHLEAVRFFTAPYNWRREALPEAFAFLQSCLPLPLHWREYDHV